MNGAEVLVETMLASGVNVCFANPGTSEMHFVAALDTHPDMRCILCLFEGGVTGAADGYARMSGNVAGTLLHLGPGFGNGWSNLHNARKAHIGIVNVVGDHADYHLKHDAPLQSDLAGVAGSVSHWLRRAGEPDELASLGTEAIRSARGGQIATIVLPADSAWGTASAPPAKAANPRAKHVPDTARITAAAAALTMPGAALLVGGPALYGAGAEIAGQIAARTGARLLAPFFAPRIERGAGAVAHEQLAYRGEVNAERLADITHLTCLGEAPPVNFFAYPDMPSTPEAPGTTIDKLCAPDWDVMETLNLLAKATGTTGAESVGRIEQTTPDLDPGPLTPDAIGRALARHAPDNAIYLNEAITAAPGIWPHVDKSTRHDRLNNAGGSIGHSLPAALGAAVACPNRPVFAVTGDGSAMYQVQTLWTAAREQLNITTIILANRGYQILHQELEAQGAPPPGRNARAMFDIEDPGLDWVALAAGHGVPATKATRGEDLAKALAKAAETNGPFLIEAMLT